MDRPGTPAGPLPPGPAGSRLDQSAAIAVTDVDGRVTSWSAGAQRLFGYTPREAVGAPLDELVGGGLPLPADGRARVVPLLDGERWAGFLFLALPADEPEQAPPDLGPYADATLMRWMFEQNPDALVVFDDDARVLRVNPGLERATGRSEAELRGLRLTEFLHGPAYEENEQRIRKVAATGVADYMEHYASRVPGETRAHVWGVDIYPLKDAGGRVRAVGLVAFDHTQETESRELLALLAEARTRIGASLEVEGTARELAEVIVPRLADFVSVDLLDEVFRGEQPPAVLSGPVALRRAAHRSVPETVLSPGGMHLHPVTSPITECMVTGRPVMRSFADPAITEWLEQDPPRAALVRKYGAHSLIAAPVRARGATLGAVTLVRHGGSPERFRTSHLTITDDLVTRAAVYVDNARRYAREHSIALALQHSLLPQGPPRLSAVEAAARYLPAGGEAGGDWFDVIPLPGARVGLVVGDVVGHGISASATMSGLRTAVRTLADIDLPPEELLTHLDDIVTHAASERETEECPVNTEAREAIGDIPGDVGATCLYAVYDPVSRVCSLARAGHPAPLLALPDGTVTVVDLPAGPPLGLGSLPFEAAEIAVPEGGVLALFTNGLLTSRGRDVDQRLEQLRRALAAPAGSLEDLCDRVLAAMRGGEAIGERRIDDIALLVARTRALDGNHVASWDLSGDPAHVAEARRRVSERLASWGLDDVVFTTELVVSELVTNAIRYGGPPIQLRLIRDHRSLICEVSDGSGTTPHMRRARLSDEGGRGLLLVAQLTDRWGTRHTPAGKTLWAEQSLASA
ncbi:SpoIIE family protein phosphatase [Streptomyces sp. MI02-7b]|uniref:SpoIIE family protein phosphatase n=1 Tax=Streptomyces sp. MI02-7b TaxID=462941 RepID=UPI0029A79D81|nr:SpoIIE family protein phosphatase [Streptomyces sp. MI02-7b]MDX3073604.1 SpoIIE family protein phosphatase [Streptomyces sp. MI02-7b]